MWLPFPLRLRGQQDERDRGRLGVVGELFGRRIVRVFGPWIITGLLSEGNFEEEGEGMLHASCIMVHELDALADVP